MSRDKNHVRILVADDEAGMRDLLCLELESQGYQVVTALNGMEALEKIKKQKYDLVITDLKMPQMDGLSLLEQIKKIAPETEVIMATGHGTVEAAVTAMKNGAYDFILKPFHLEELNALIEKVLEKKELKTLVALYKASHAIFSTMELGELLELIMNMSQTVLGADEGSLMLFNENQKLIIVASRGLSNDVARQVQLEIGERVAGFVAKEKRGRLFVNGLQKYEELKGISGNPKIQSSIVCPLFSRQELLGVLNLNRTNSNSNFTLADFQSASIFASQAALAIQNAKLYSTLRDAYQKLERAQGQLIQSEKLASVGRLVAGVAHELNNPLTAVIGYSQLAKESQDLEEIHKQLPIIASQALRCSTIVKDLLLFARHQKLNSEVFDPQLLMEDVLKGMSLELEKRKVTVKKEEFLGAPVFLQADPHLLKQVFSNILTNAYQALETTSHPRVIEIKTWVEEESLHLSFCDNGPGIPKESIHKIFDPFYTTKEVGKGTGLGLSLTYGIIREHGGTISVESEMGKQTTFFIVVPLKAKRGEMAFSSVPDRPKDSSFQLAAHTKILLVEDEPSIRTLITQIFSEQDYEIETVADGMDGLEKLRNHDYDLVMCDYRMPRLNGVEFYEQACLLHPELAKRFLFITGSTEFMRNFDSFFEMHSLVCLLKPFTREELISAVNTVGNNGKEGKQVENHGNV